MKKEEKGNLEDFLNEYEELCKKYNISITCEYDYGAMVFQEYDELNIRYVRNGVDERKSTE